MLQEPKKIELPEVLSIYHFALMNFESTSTGQLRPKWVELFPVGNQLQQPPQMKIKAEKTPQNLTSRIQSASKWLLHHVVSVSGFSFLHTTLKPFLYH